MKKNLSSSGRLIKKQKLFIILTILIEFFLNQKKSTVLLEIQMPFKCKPEGATCQRGELIYLNQSRDDMNLFWALSLLWRVLQFLIQKMLFFLLLKFLRVLLGIYYGQSNNMNGWVWVAENRMRILRNVRTPKITHTCSEGVLDIGLMFFGPCA